MKNFIRRANHKRIDYGKALSLSLFKFAFDRPPQIRQTPSQDILILRLDGKLGDSIVTTGFLNSIHKSFFNSQITVVCGYEAKGLYENLDFVTVIPTKKGLLETLRLWNRLKGIEYKTIINTSHILNSRTLFLASRLKGEQKIGLKSQDYKTFCTSIEFDSYNDHVTHRFEKICKAINCSVIDLRYFIPISQSANKQIEDFIRRRQLGDFIVLNSFAGARYRCLSKEKTFEIVRLLLDLFPNISVLSIGNEGDLKILKQWVHEFSDSRWIIKEDAFSLLENACLIKFSTAVITPDTSIVHLACAFDKPLLSIYRPDSGLEKNSKIWAPLGTLHLIVYSNEPAPGHEADISDFTWDRGQISTFIAPLLNNRLPNTMTPQGEYS